jgi:hypothetical protein
MEVDMLKIVWRKSGPSSKDGISERKRSRVVGWKYVEDMIWG